MEDILAAVFILIVLGLYSFLVEPKAKQKQFERENSRRRQEDNLQHVKARQLAKNKLARSSTDATTSRKEFFIYLFLIERSNWMKVGVTKHCSRSRMEDYECKHYLRADYSSLIQVSVTNKVFEPEEFEALVHAQLDARGFKRVLWESGREFFAIPEHVFGRWALENARLQRLEELLKTVVSSALAEIGETTMVSVERGPTVAKYPVEYQGQLQRPTVFDNYHRLQGSRECITLQFPSSNSESEERETKLKYRLRLHNLEMQEKAWQEVQSVEDRVEQTKVPCSSCGVKIPHATAKRNVGLCDACVPF